MDPVAEEATVEPLPAEQASEPVTRPPGVTPRAAQVPARKREYPGLLRHYRRLLNLLAVVFLGVGLVGWTYRWHVLREVLLQFEATQARTRDVRPLLCETLLHDPVAKRRLRAAELLRLWGHKPFENRGAAVWDALLDATMDGDTRVAEAAWESLEVPNAPDDGDYKLLQWFHELPVSRCVELLSRTKCLRVRKELLERLKVLDAAAFWTTARWALQSLDDPKAANVVLEDAHFRLYARGGQFPTHAMAMRECLEAGLENRNPRIRDRCRRLFLDNVWSGGPATELVEWIRSTRDVSTIEVTVRIVRCDPTLDWETPLKERLAQEPDFDTAVELSAVVGQMAGTDREAEFLREGLKNPDPQIRECFERLLEVLERPPDPPVEPDDGR